MSGNDDLKAMFIHKSQTDTKEDIAKLNAELKRKKVELRKEQFFASHPDLREIHNEYLRKKDETHKKMEAAVKAQQEYTLKRAERNKPEPKPEPEPVKAKAPEPVKAKAPEPKPEPERASELVDLPAEKPTIHEVAKMKPPTFTPLTVAPPQHLKTVRLGLNQKWF